jgi:hypothetical protein
LDYQLLENVTATKIVLSELGAKVAVTKINRIKRKIYKILDYISIFSFISSVLYYRKLHSGISTIKNLVVFLILIFFGIRMGAISLFVMLLINAKKCKNQILCLFGTLLGIAFTPSRL